MADGILFVIGASGAGKTAATARLAERQLAGVSVHHFDTIGVPEPIVMDRDFGGPDRWQQAATVQWIDRLAREDGLTVLEGQSRPSFIRSAAVDADQRVVRIVLLHCDAAVRNHRLCNLRHQSELSNPDMDAWAAYLLQQAKLLDIPVVDTSELSVDAIADALEQELAQLRRTAATT